MTSTRACLSLGTVTLTGAMLWSASAHAHIDLVDPPSRYGQANIKDAPCGHPNNPPSTTPPVEYMAGETITITVDEFVGHTGHLRVAFAEDDADIVTVTAFDDFDNFPGVLLDNITDAAGQEQFMIDVTLPDEPCVNCTLQVIQVMYDGNGFQEEDLYYTCANITLLGGEGTGDGTGGDGTGSGGGDAGATDTGGADETTGIDTGEDPSGDAPDGSDDTQADGEDSGSATEATGGSDGTGSDAGGGDDDGGGCSCRSTSPRAASWILLGLVGVAIGRRRAQLVKPS